MQVLHKQLGVQDMDLLSARQFAPNLQKAFSVRDKMWSFKHTVSFCISSVWEEDSKVGKKSYYMF